MRLSDRALTLVIVGASLLGVYLQWVAIRDARKVTAPVGGVGTGLPPSTGMAG